jgi:hypothetical protein
VEQAATFGGKVDAAQVFGAKLLIGMWAGLKTRLRLVTAAFC